MLSSLRVDVLAGVSTINFKQVHFDISIQTGIPILPVFLHYEAQEVFEWHEPHTLLDKFWHFMTAQNNRANYYVFDAIKPEEFSDKAEYAEHVASAVFTLANALP